jgi:hypothetical protein
MRHKSHSFNDQLDENLARVVYIIVTSTRCHVSHQLQRCYRTTDTMFPTC